MVGIKKPRDLSVAGAFSFAAVFYQMGDFMGVSNRVPFL
jgi:hypothetical protein